MSLRIPIKTLNLVPSGTRTSNGNSGPIVINDLDMENLLIRLNVTAASGTLDVFFQQSLDGGSTWVDVGRFSQITGTTNPPHYISLAVGATNTVNGAVGDGTISAGTLGVNLVSNVWRVRWLIGGASPSFTFAVDAFYA